MTYHFNEVSTVAIDPVVETLVDQALAAQREIENWSEQRIDMLLHALADVVAGHAHALAVATVAETGMGNVRDKTLKNSLASVGVYRQLAGQIGLGEIGFDRDRRVAEIASPVGVIVGLVPATHPVATFIFKSLIAIKGRNAIIFSPSRRAQQVSQEVGRLIQKELIAHGAPVSLVQWIGDRKYPRNHGCLDEPSARRAGAGNRRSGHGQGRVSVGYAGDRCGARKRSGADQRRRRHPTGGTQHRDEQVV